MLEIKVPKDSDVIDIEKIIMDNNLKIENIQRYISTCMAVYDQEQIIGATGFIQKDSYALIKFIVVEKDRRLEYIGDGLLKALLNLANIRGVTKVILDDEGLFFNKLGFNTVLQDDAVKYRKIFEEEGINPQGPMMEVTLPDFFLRVCKSSSNTNKV